MKSSSGRKSLWFKWNEQDDPSTVEEWIGKTTELRMSKSSLENPRATIIKIPIPLLWPSLERCPIISSSMPFILGMIYCIWLWFQLKSPSLRLAVPSREAVTTKDPAWGEAALSWWEPEVAACCRGTRTAKTNSSPLEILAMAISKWVQVPWQSCSNTKNSFFQAKFGSTLDFFALVLVGTCAPRSSFTVYSGTIQGQCLRVAG